MGKPFLVRLLASGGVNQPPPPLIFGVAMSHCRGDITLKSEKYPSLFSSVWGTMQTDDE